MSALTTFEHMIDSDGTADAQDRAGFCWSKYGVEAGQSVDAILARKEAERLTNDGVFLWGIGSNIRPALRALVHAQREVPVRFSAMRSRPKAHDQAPAQVVVWRAGESLDGKPFELPSGSVVTSRASSARHFALACRSDRPLREARQLLDAAQLENWASGAPVGHSQVTSIVRRSADATRSGTRYETGFSAVLTYPYLISLTAGYVVDGEIAQGHGADLGALMSLRDLAFGFGEPWGHGRRGGGAQRPTSRAAMLDVEGWDPASVY